MRARFVARVPVGEQARLVLLSIRVFPVRDDFCRDERCRRPIALEFGHSHRWPFLVGTGSRPVQAERRSAMTRRVSAGINPGVAPSGIEFRSSVADIAGVAINTAL